MTPAELANACQQQIDFHRTRGIGTKPHLYLTLTAPRYPGRLMRLLGRRGPFGEICSVATVGGERRAVVLFDARRVLRWLEREEEKEIPQ